MTNISLSDDEFDFSHGIRIQKTFAHFMSANLMAFAPAPPGKPHPAPWRAAKGGFGFDIAFELSVPTDSKLPCDLSPSEAIWWITALLRLAAAPDILVPVISDMSFQAAKTSDEEPEITPFEILPRIFRNPNGQNQPIGQEDLIWVRDHWVRSVEMAKDDSTFGTALKAWDDGATKGRTSSLLLTVWGALEQLFSPAQSEIRYRIASNIASFLEPAGEKRLELYKTILSLYNERSKAAHTAKEIDAHSLISSWIILRNALVKVISDQKIPTQTDFERLLFVGH